MMGWMALSLTRRSEPWKTWCLTCLVRVSGLRLDGGDRLSILIVECEAESKMIARRCDGIRKGDWMGSGWT